MPRLWLCGLLMLLLGCGSTERVEDATPPRDAAAGFTALEERLLNAGTVRLDFHVTAEGAFEADLRGNLEIGPAEQVRLMATGHFGGEPVELLLRSREGDEIEFGNGSNRATTTRPPLVREAILVGITRMGILHNLARLTSARAPDYAEGGVREWVQVGSFAAGAGESDALAFDVMVDGERAGTASLEIDPQGRPTVRRQTVQFPSGEMQVVERYSSVTIDP